MGQTCSTETCCNKEGNRIGEVSGDMKSMSIKGDESSGHKPFHADNMSESARRRLVDIGSGRQKNQVPLLIQRVIKIQALFRGYMVRTRLSVIRNLLSSGTENGEFDEAIREEDLLRNPQVKEVYEKEGPFEVPDLPGDGSEEYVQKGPYRLTSGAIYIGQWSKDMQKRMGKGRQAWPDGSLFEGQWMDGRANGIGRLIHSDGDIYQGEWRDDKANGIGKYIHYDGTIYEGEWRDDKQHGQGCEIWPDEARYEGSYVNGTKDGQGNFFWNDGASYSGEFRLNDIAGEGRYKWSDGRNYVGTWDSNKMHGRGVFRWSDGRVYEGEFYNDRKHGTGVLTWPDGRKYEGSWVNGKQHGRGQFTDLQANVKNGQWQEGKVIGWLDDKGVLQKIAPSDN